MSKTTDILSIGPNELAAADPTPGILREKAFATDRAIFTRVRVEPNVSSGWHYHGSREVLGYLVRGRARLDFGPGGKRSTEIQEGGFFHVPVGVVHRDVNPTDEPQEFVIAFVGTGPLVVNVEGPDPGAGTEPE
ncbi:MAG TPA: cupin domain-containing protein [Candidatus Krumholzibacteria bacterium]|nr:cupin domain-containing protein [Candidatus Krumholzibacteria bacterium]